MGCHWAICRGCGRCGWHGGCWLKKDTSQGCDFGITFNMHVKSTNLWDLVWPYFTQVLLETCHPNITVNLVGTDGKGWRRLMEGCWTSLPFIVASSWHINIVAHHCRLIVTSPGCVVVIPYCCHWLVVVLSCVSMRWVGGKVGWEVLT